MSEACPSIDPIYQLRIQLRGVSPPLWRRILLSSSTTIADLHTVIQAAMGWEDIHLNRFTIRGQWYGVPHEGGIYFHADTEDLPLTAFDFHADDRFEYEYDFYSHWMHDIRMERVLHDIEMRNMPRCISGVGACAPEDSGSPERFMDLQDNHSVFDLLEWLQDALADNEPMDMVREELVARIPWAIRWFDREATNARLKELDCYIG